MSGRAASVCKPRWRRSRRVRRDPKAWDAGLQRSHPQGWARKAARFKRCAPSGPGFSLGTRVIEIVAGEFRRRRLKTPAGDKTRPTSGRVREAWFNILQASIPGARVLDLFAGSGALGLEALSRGAVSAEFVERGRPALEALRANIAALGVGDRATVHRGDAVRFVERLQPGQYDVAFADPPYA